MKLRTPAELRELAEAAAREHRDPYLAIYDAGRMDATGRMPAAPAGGYESFSDAVDRYVSNIARHRGVTRKDLLGGESSRRVANARAEVVWVLRTLEELSYLDLAPKVGLKDHTSCIAAFRRVAARIEANPRLREELLAVAARGGCQDPVAAPLRSVA